MKTRVTRCLALTIGLLAAVQVFAQVGSRTLSGTITSPDGSRITTARLSIKNIANDDTKYVSAKHDGYYVIRKMLPGSYGICVSACDFDEIHTRVTFGG